MKAWVLQDINDINFADVELPAVSEGEVLIKVRAAGICGSDIPRIYDTGAHRMPLIPGHEFAGEVVSVKEMKDLQSGMHTGENLCESSEVSELMDDGELSDVSELMDACDPGQEFSLQAKWSGKRVGIFPLIPCKKCPCCLQKKYEMCQNYSYLGSRRDGGFAEYVAVPEWNLLELPDMVDIRAAAMMEPMAVSIHAIRRILGDMHGTETENKTIVVCGLGTIGLLITMFLLDAGAQKLYVIGNKDFQKEQVLKLGISADKYYDASNRNMKQAKDWIDAQTGGWGADYFFECVGRNETISLSLDAAAPGGSVCMVGNPFSDMELPRNTYWNILRRQLRVTGTWNSSYYGKEDNASANSDDWLYVRDALAKGRVHPEMLISHTYELQDLRQGFEIMHGKTEEYVKIMAVL